MELNITKLKIVLLALWVSIPSFVLAGTLRYVPSGGSPNYATIALANTAASAGDTIILTANDTEQVTTLKSLVIQGSSQSITWSNNGTLMNFSSVIGPISIMNLTLNNTGTTGSIIADSNNSMSVSIINCTLESTGGTSGAYITDNNNYNLYLYGSKLIGNANSSGGVYVQNGSGSNNWYIINSLVYGFTKNTSFAIQDNNSNSVILNSDIVNNYFGYSQTNGSSAPITDTVFYCTNTDYTSGKVTGDYNALHLGAAIGTHSLTAIANSVFNNYASNDFTLPAGSALIDKGTSTSTGGVTADIIGTTRPQGTAYDIGAYEYVPPTPTQTPTNTPASTPTDTATSTPTASPTDSPTITPTFSPTNSATDTATATITDTPTITPTPTDTPICFYGDQTAGSINSPSGSYFNTAWAYVLNLSSPVTVYSLSLYSKNGGTNARVAVYSGSAFSPNTLQVQSTSQAVVAGWNSFDVTPTILSAGNYWLALQIQDGSLSYDITDCAQQYASFGMTYGSFPPTASGWSGGTCQIFPLYMNICAPPTATPTNTGTDTPTSTPTDSPTQTPTNSPTNTATKTATSTITDTPTNTATPTYTACVATAPSYDNDATVSGATGNAGVSTTLTFGASSGGSYVLFVEIDSSGAFWQTTLGTITYNGVAMTKLVGPVTYSGNQNVYRALYYAINPASGSPLTISGGTTPLGGGNQWVYRWFTYSNTNSTSPLGTISLLGTNSAAGSSNTPVTATISGFTPTSSASAIVQMLLTQGNTCLNTYTTTTGNVRRTLQSGIVSSVQPGWAFSDYAPGNTIAYNIQQGFNPQNCGETGYGWAIEVMPKICPCFDSSWNTCTFTPTATNTASNTATNTATSTATKTATQTPTDTATQTATKTPTNTGTDTATQTPTATATDSPTSTATDTPTDTTTDTATSTPTDTATETTTSTPSDTATDTATETPSDTATTTATDTATSTPTDTATETATSTPTDTMTDTATETASDTATTTSTDTATSTPTDTASETTTSTPTDTATDTATESATSTATFTPTETATDTASGTPTATASDTPTSTESATFTDTATHTATETATSTPTDTTTETHTDTATESATSTPTDTATETSTMTATATPSDTATETATGTPTLTATATATSTPSGTPTDTATTTATFTPTDSPTPGSAQNVDPVVYPNPLKDTDTLTLTVGFAKPTTWLQIKVFTVADRRVKNVTLQSLPAGMNTIPVEMKDDWGTPLADGLYYLYLVTPDQKFTKKVLILR